MRKLPHSIGIAVGGNEPKTVSLLVLDFCSNSSFITLFFVVKVNLRRTKANAKVTFNVLFILNGGHDQRNVSLSLSL